MLLKRSRSFVDRRQSSLINWHLTLSKDFFFETTGPISFSFHMQSFGKRAKKVYTFGTGHMSEMAAMPIYGTHPKNSSREALSQLP